MTRYLRQKWCRLLRNRGTSLRRAWSRATIASVGGILLTFLKLLTSTRALRASDSLMSTSTVRSQVGVVDSGNFDMLVMYELLELKELTERDRSGGARILVAVIINQALEFIDVALSLIHDDLIVNRSSGTLNGGVGA
jgi:hypothetical protein